MTWILAAELAVGDRLDGGRVTVLDAREQSAIGRVVAHVDYAGCRYVTGIRTYATYEPVEVWRAR